MCGIAGAIDLTGIREFSPERLAAMTGAIAHRGPDDEQFHVERGVALGARRLAVIDLAGGQQPVGNEDETIWVAFNGELFDYRELRRGLLASGHRLRTRCDTEAWVHLYEEYGQAMFERDARSVCGFALGSEYAHAYSGRDRVGICPLYYSQADGWLLWGSEIRAILASGVVSAQADVRGIDHFFTFFGPGTTRTFFEGVKSLPPGNFLRIRDGRITQHQYWDLDFPDAGSERRLEDSGPLVEEFEAILRGAVERRLRSDVPVVSYISGGLDSTVVLGMCGQQRGGAIPSFTVGLDRAGPDERTQAAEAAETLGSPLLTTIVDRAGIADAYPELVRAAECPVLDTSCDLPLRLAQSVHDRGYKVVLTGEGADEALAGYVWYKAQAWVDAVTRRMGNRLPQLAGDFLKRSVAGFRARIPGNPSIGGVRPVQFALYEMISLVKPAIYSAGLKEKLADHNAYSDLDVRADRIKQWHPLNQSLYAGYKIMLPGMLLLSKGDRIAMNASVETRYPYLDEDVVAFLRGYWAGIQAARND